MPSTLDRIARSLGQADIVDILADLPGTDLQSLLLAVAARRSARRQPADLMRDYEQSRFFGASPLSWSDFADWAALARDCARDFEFLLLSPMAPLASCAAVANVGQDWSVPTVRTGEVVSDPTNILALEAGLRRKHGQTGPLHLATMHRVIRPQAYADRRSLAHFSLFALVSSGRDTGSFNTEAGMIEKHFATYLQAFRRFLGSAFPLSISYTAGAGAMRERQHELLRDFGERHAVRVWHEADRAAVDSYYAGFCFHIWAELPSGRQQLADGGTVDWVEKLSSNAKERTLISGCGIDGLIALRLREGAP
jgi:hypothetical protein